MSHYDETVFEIWRMAEKRCYYLMSAAGAGIGYSIATIDADIDVFQSRILLASLLCWAISFFSGLATIANLKIVIGGFAVTPNNLAEAKSKGSEEVEKLIQGINQFSSHLGARSKLHHSTQIAFLSFGALLLVMTKIDISKALGLAS
ncbi:hypothetical protein BCF46_1647 [Litoreibacter meonggei]|uniref:Uncharacterized protein n=1 Tax=Litoreibacter meonggei TaxID=1049199 RepID=A0A497WYS5_9RHOB|nr:hypothetical protein [Litoreibacter meonggei]RLJ59498.1 hypothetical protein BCF46_1647 [Litoreibacter meonggei]